MQNQPDKLYYYCLADKALRILETASLDGFTPLILDGVTELNGDSSLKFDKENLTKSTVKIACSLIFGHEVPQGETPLLAAIRRWRESERFTNNEEAEVVLRTLCEKMVDQHFIELNALLADWHKACSKLHLLSLYEKPDNFTLWQKEAAHFSGVSFRFSFGEDTLFKNITKVQYQNIQPEITTLKEQIGALIYNTKPSTEKHFLEKFSNKAPAFRNENEWRVFRKNEKSSPENPQFEFNRAELKAVYLGPKIDTDIRKKLLAVVHKNQPDTKVYQMRFASGKFDLVTEAV